MSAFDIEAQKLGVMGVTIIASSGDDGAVGPKVRGSISACSDGYTIRKLT